MVLIDAQKLTSYAQRRHGASPAGGFRRDMGINIYKRDGGFSGFLHGFMACVFLKPIIELPYQPIYFGLLRLGAKERAI